MIRRNRVLMFSIILLLLTVMACNSDRPQETAVIEIELIGLVANPDSEVSGLAWYENHLVFLPQYQDLEEINPDNHPKLYTLTKEEILAYLAALDTGKSPLPLEPRAIDFIIQEKLYEKICKIKGFEGFEAIAFRENKVFMTIEASPGQMLGYLVAGEVETTADSNRFTITLKPTQNKTKTGSQENELIKIQPQTSIKNRAYETLLVTKDEVIAFYEVNGKHDNVSPLAYVYDHDLNFIGTVPFPTVEYRITDATRPDADNRFWCINYFWPGDKKTHTAPDSLMQKYGKGKTHARSEIVERLVELEYIKPPGNPRFILSDRPPVQLELLGSQVRYSRNWEGIVRLDDPGYRGFLLVTDKFPRTIFGFVEF